jgi:hypothetical protein
MIEDFLFKNDVYEGENESQSSKIKIQDYSLDLISVAANNSESHCKKSKMQHKKNKLDKFSFTLETCDSFSSPLSMI